MSMRPHSWMSPRCCLSHTCIPRWKWLSIQPSLHQQLLSKQYLLPLWKHLLLPQHNHLLLLQHPHASYSEKSYSSSPHSAEDTCTCRYKTELMSHLANLLTQLRYHKTLFSICKYNHDDVTGWASTALHNRYHQKTLKGSALKAYLPN